jgi:predicted GNAT superfamily acetyltransferase
VTASPYRIRDLRSIEDCRKVVELEKLVWGYTDAEDVVPVPILVVTVRRGGVLLGAFDDAGEMAGFVYSLAGLRDGRPMQWSHMLGVLPAARDAGLGMRLKLEQRQRTLEMGLDLIEWTFDPLQALNAHLNFAKLGVVAEEYEENVYGESSSPLHRGTPTDRLIAQWWIRTDRVAKRIAPDGGPAVRDVSAIDDAWRVNVLRRDGRWPACDRVDLTRTDARLVVEIPTGLTELQASEPALAREWRQATREIFTTYFARGYQAVEFFLDRAGGVGRYLLAREE